MKYNKGTFITMPNKHILSWQKPIVQCVYMWLCDFEKDGLCFPSVKTIAKNAWCSDRAVRGAIQHLIKLGILGKAHNIKNNAYTSNTYHILLKEEETERQAGGTEPDAVPTEWGAGGTEWGADRIKPIEPKPINSNSSKEEEQSSTLVEYEPKEITKKINHLVNMIKEKCDELGVAYDKDKDRNFARHILTAKEYWSFCEKISMSREDFAVAVLQASVQISYWKWPRAWPKNIYQDYADVYNQAKWHIQKNQVVDLSMYNKPNG